jgi:hypothetical protein
VIRHVALFRFRAGLQQSELDAFHEAVTALPELVPAISATLARPTLGLQPGGFDYVLMVDVQDEDAFAAYKRHPAHLRLIEEHIRPCVAETARAQLRL